MLQVCWVCFGRNWCKQVCFVHLHSGPEIDTPEDKKQSGLDLHVSTSLSSSSSSHQHSSEWSEDSSLSSQASTLCERARSGSAPAAPSACVTTYGGPQNWSEGLEGGRFSSTTSGVSPAAPTEMESTVQGQLLLVYTKSGLLIEVNMPCHHVIGTGKGTTLHRNWNSIACRNFINHLITERSPRSLIWSWTLSGVR